MMEISIPKTESGLTYSNNGISPISFDSVPAPIRALGTKSPEEKIYIVLYNRTDEDSNGFIICEGRYDCYVSIERIVNTYPIDIHNSVVLVEVPAVNKNNNGEWMMKHPANASSIYQFCKTVEKMFPAHDFSIDDFNDKNLEADNDPEIPVTETDLRASYSNAVASDADTEIAKSYQQMLLEGSNN